MTDAKPSAVSRIMRLFATQPVAGDERQSRDRDEDRIPAAAEIERRLGERSEAFFWTWQYPGQW